MGMHDALGVLSERPFRYQFLASTTSVLGDNIVSVALAFAIFELTGSAADLGIVLGARTVALIVFFLVGGVWADRLPRQRLMMMSDLGRAGTQAALGILLVTGVAQLWHFVLLEVLNGVATAFFRPAETGLTPLTVSPPRLRQANALLSLGHSASGIVGPALAGLVVAVAGPGVALIFDGATFAISALFLLRINLPRSAQRLERSRFLSDLRNGWHEVRSRSWVWISILNFMHFQLIALPAFFVLGPFISDRHLGGASAWATVLALAGAGSVVGNIAALRISSERPLRTAYLSMLLAPPVLIALALKGPLWLVAATAIPWGISMTFFNAFWFTALQKHIPEGSISKVSSYDWMGSTALRPLGFALIAPLADAFGITPTLIVIASIIAVVEVATALVPSISALPAEPEPSRNQGAVATSPGSPRYRGITRKGSPASRRGKASGPSIRGPVSEGRRSRLRPCPRIPGRGSASRIGSRVRRRTTGPRPGRTNACRGA